MPQKLPANNFNWVEDASEFDESFIESYNKESANFLKGYFLEVDIQYAENYIKPKTI